jgi:hypothetical protein
MPYTISSGCTRHVRQPLEYNNKSKLSVSAFKITDVTRLSKNVVSKYKTRYSAIHTVWGVEASI